MEKQITDGAYGHFLNPVQAFSPDDRWLVYDTRNDDAHIGRTGKIERVQLETKEVEEVYSIPHQTLYGPGVGAAAYSPVEDQVIFIHGIGNSDADRPYGVTRRTGVVVSMKQPGMLKQWDARDLTAPYTLGALRGGSHAHSWSGDGTCVSFTYNDEIMNRLSMENPGVEDLRTVGVMMPWGKVEVESDPEGENHSGEMFSMVVADVTSGPEYGSDKISKAYEEGWIGTNGYLDTDGQRRQRAIAFLGDVRTRQGEMVTEVFVVDLPDAKPSLDGETHIAGGHDFAPQPLSVVRQRRVTYTQDRKFPGVQGPRQWMKSSPDGRFLYFMMKDDDALVQLFSIPTNGGGLRQITSNPFSISTAFDIDPTGRWAAFGVEEQIYRVDLETGRTENLTSKAAIGYTDLRAIQWSRSGKLLAYNRKVANGDTSYFQIFTLSIPADE